MKILGMMSGTSGDGIDGALVEFNNSDFKLIWHKSYDFTQEQFIRIQELMKSCSSIEVTLGNSYIAELYAKAVQYFLYDNSDEKPNYIAAHGQTIWHQPQTVTWDGIELRGTLQILDAPLLANKIGIPVISNFRNADMAVGGQGAPLVPFADLELFGNLFDEDCIVLNIGGMANITAIRKINGHPEVLCAFDTGPGNVLMDAFVQNKGIGHFDKDGMLAAAGTPIKSILDEIMKDSYFLKPYPKSTGREYFNSSIFKYYNEDIKTEDFMATLLEVTVLSVAKAIMLTKNELKFPLKLIVAGGGAKNTVLMRRLKEELSGFCEVIPSDNYGVPVMAREAMAFAVLGKAFIDRRPANVITATGASKPVILGQLSPIL